MPHVVCCGGQHRIDGIPKGTLEDAINTMMAAAAYNMRHWMDKNASSFFVSWLLALVRRLENVIFGVENKSTCRCPTLAMVAK